MDLASVRGTDERPTACFCRAGRRFCINLLAALAGQQRVGHLGSRGDGLLLRNMPRRPPRGWSPDYFSGAVFYCRSMSELLEQRKQLVLIDRRDENSGATARSPRAAAAGWARSAAACAWSDRRT